MSQDKESPERHNDCLQNIRCIPHGSFGLSQGKSSSEKNMLVDKISRKTSINSKMKGLQIRCIPHGRWGLAQFKSTREEHPGSDKSFDNITLCLDQLPLKIQFIKEKRTLKSVVLSRETNTLPQCKSSCKKTSWFWQTFGRKTLFLDQLLL